MMQSKVGRPLIPGSIEKNIRRQCSISFVSMGYSPWIPFRTSNPRTCASDFFEVVLKKEFFMMVTLNNGMCEVHFANGAPLFKLLILNI
ncbi:MAG: hypothetical protein H7833_10725 [Magnetococcus sp. DMHC-1]|nr:hypothetical protein [Magnetococcales bacterium]